MSSNQHLGFSPSRSSRLRRQRRKTLLMATAISVIGGGSGFAAEGDANEALLKKMEAMEQRIQSLEAELRQKKAPGAEKRAASGETVAPKEKQSAASEKMPTKAIPAEENKT